ncbi:TPA: hypothetical protein ACN7S0_004042 [Klebsiella pneumoniae]|uniref:Flagellar biosynthesis, cell-distal portion of basal-body rod n=2 Tax=Enterobacterales TaxID=91347 RepID=A0A2X3FBZ1_KLEPN|nr:hypothetical protein [Klebsiella pneumoniae]VFS40128.1 Uncharacterised protein [Serratia liquefaciens]RLO14510.1 hypothetical protein D1220_00285 [Klebsiella pneumoniae]RLO15211.1 hypothetical protein D1220_04360 [Klebsiella pneumoniae]RLO15598.1 hypothetical protein D1220_06635 [Klebsiella pneumoniae]SQC20350.1 Uncharacterised protein [Klebsiella pneumoniae]
MPKTLPESPEWVDGIYQVELDTPVLGGDGGPDNWQAQQLANRTSYLKQRTDMIDDRLQSATGDYASVAEAQAAIDSGSETRRYFNVMLFDNNWVERYENVNGVATPTGIRLPSSQAVDELSASLDEANALIARLTLLTAPLRKYISTKYTFSVNTAEGPVSTGLALDRDMGLWLPGLKAELQQYVQQLIPWSIANRYPGYQLMFTDVTGKKGIVSIDDNGDVRVLGIDDVLQERLAALCSSTFARRINGFQFVIFSSDLKSALFAIDDDGGVHIPGIKGALQDNLGQQPARITPYQGLPAVYWNDALLWHERPVLSVNQVSATGLSMTYIPGGQITKGYGMMYYRGGAEISPEAMKALILCSDGQSLGVPSDAGNRPNPNTWNKVNYDPKWRAYALAIAGGKPEGSQDTPITEAMLDLLANLVYPLYRQGQQLPFVYALLYSHENADLNLPVMFSAVANSGGKSFAQIWKGTVPYSNGLAMVERYVKIAQALGKPASVDVVSLEHGETDNDNGTSQNVGDYRVRMEAYYALRRADYKALTGQTTEILAVIGQVGSRINTKAGGVDEQGNPTGESVVVKPFSVVAVDQLQFVKNNPTNAIMYGPKYPLNWLYSDGSLSHLDNWGKVLQGEYQEQAIFWHLYDPARKGTWTGLKIKSVTLTDNIADLLCDVPFAPIVIDADFIADCLNKGVGLENNSATVQSITIVDGNIIRVVFDQAPAATDALLMGFTNTAEHSPENDSVYPLTCFRDSSPRVSRWVTRNGSPFPLYNWMCLDRIPLTQE